MTLEVCLASRSGITPSSCHFNREVVSNYQCLIDAIEVADVRHMLYRNFMIEEPKDDFDVAISCLH